MLLVGDETVEEVSEWNICNAAAWKSSRLHHSTEPICSTSFVASATTICHFSSAGLHDECLSSCHYTTQYHSIANSDDSTDHDDHTTDCPKHDHATDSHSHGRVGDDSSASSSGWFQRICCSSPEVVHHLLLDQLNENACLAFPEVELSMESWSSPVVSPLIWKTAIPSRCDVRSILSPIDQRAIRIRMLPRHRIW